jgi:hypothetical protein
LPPDTYVILGITLDDNNVYIWDTGDNVWTNATVDTGVSQII